MMLESTTKDMSKYCSKKCCVKAPVEVSETIHNNRPPKENELFCDNETPISDIPQFDHVPPAKSQEKISTYATSSKVKSYLSGSIGMTYLTVTCLFEFFSETLNNTEDCSRSNSSDNETSFGCSLSKLAQTFAASDRINCYLSSFSDFMNDFKRRIVSQDFFAKCRKLCPQKPGLPNFFAKYSLVSESLELLSEYSNFYRDVIKESIVQKLFFTDLRKFKEGSPASQLAVSTSVLDRSGVLSDKNLISPTVSISHPRSVLPFSGQAQLSSDKFEIPSLRAYLGMDKTEIGWVLTLEYPRVCTPFQPHMLGSGKRRRRRQVRKHSSQGGSGSRPSSPTSPSGGGMGGSFFSRGGSSGSGSNGGDDGRDKKELPRSATPPPEDDSPSRRKKNSKKDQKQKIPRQIARAMRLSYETPRKSVCRQYFTKGALSTVGFESNCVESSAGSSLQIITGGEVWNFKPSSAGHFLDQTTVNTEGDSYTAESEWPPVSIVTQTIQSEGTLSDVKPVSPNPQHVSYANAVRKPHCSPLPVVTSSPVMNVKQDKKSVHSGEGLRFSATEVPETQSGSQKVSQSVDDGSLPSAMVVLAHRLSPSIPPIEEESVAVDNSSGRLPLTYPPVGHMLVFIAPLLLFFGPEDEEHPLASLWLGGNGCFNTLFGFVQCSVPRVSQGSQSRQLSISACLEDCLEDSSSGYVFLPPTRTQQLSMGGSLEDSVRVFLRPALHQRSYMDQARYIGY